MNLHEDKSVFQQILEDTAVFMKLPDAGIVGKDYFITLFLRKITEKIPGVILKGGTSLTKCYKAIDRFSEDIDLSMETEAAKLSEGQRKKLKQDIVSIIDELKFNLVNPDQIRSRRDFNRYVVDFQPKGLYPFLNQHLIIETAIQIKPFPTVEMDAGSYIYDFLIANGVESETKKYDLEPFKIKVQSIERTFIDKVFALADYYLDGNIETHSRHIYDLYKLYPKIVFDEKFKLLTTEVREARKTHDTCHSAQSGVDMQELLKKITSEDYYKSDYDRITATLLFEEVPYNEAITVLSRVLSDGCFSI